MKIWNYDPISGVLVGEGVADASPLENDVFLIPANATEIAPPEIPNGKLAVFIDGAWQLVNIPTPPPETPEAVAQRLEDAVQRVLDSAAQAHGYDSASRCIGYFNSTNDKWKAEAIAMNQWRDDVWAHCAQVQSDVQEDIRSVPTEAELIAELPELVWPA